MTGVPAQVDLPTKKTVIYGGDRQESKSVRTLVTRRARRGPRGVTSILILKGARNVRFKSKLAQMREGGSQFCQVVVEFLT